MRAVRSAHRQVRTVTIVLAAVWSAAPAAAQVVLDGTTGPAGALSGPDYAIPAELGRRAGVNLFHSFERFSLHTGETATFSGPVGIANVISRVTGGERSDIDGALRSTIPGADLWFLNPAGVVFGPNATLDLQGSFHISTADELRFDDGTRFSATDPSASSFTVAAPEAFGFLGAEPAGLVVDRSHLSVGAGETISLVGGDITVTAGSDGLVSGGDAGTVRAEAGRVALVALGGPGAAGATGGEITAEALAEIRLTDQALVDASGDGGGTVRIRGGRLVVENESFIFADNIRSTDARGGIDVEAGAVTIADWSGVTADAMGSGDGGPLVVRAGEVLVTGVSRIRGSTRGEGDAGAVTVRAEDMEVRDGSFISGDTAGGGGGGAVTVKAGRLLVSGDGSGFFTGITSDALPGTGDAGAVTVRADALEVRDGGQISSGAFAGAEGDAGAVTVEAGRLLVSSDGSEFFTGIASQANQGSTGDAGAVTVRAGDLQVRDGAEISTSTFAAGAAGAVTVEADRLLVSGDGSGFFTGIASGAGGGSSGDAGVVAVRAGELQVRNGGVITSSTPAGGAAGSVTVEAGRLVISGDGADGFTGIRSQALAGATGAAGSVEVSAPVVILADGGAIASSSDGTGPGGGVVIRAREAFRSKRASVTAAAADANAGDVTIVAGRLIDLVDSEVTTSAAVGRGSGGNIFIDPEFVVLDGSRIVANARVGAGGNIDIQADFLFQTPNGVIDASSELGIDGEVNVEAPDVDVTSGLAALPTAFVDASSLLQESCAARGGDEAGSFIGVGRGGLPPTPDAPLPGFYYALGRGAPEPPAVETAASPSAFLDSCGGSFPRVRLPG